MCPRVPPILSRARPGRGVRTSRRCRQFNHWYAHHSYGSAAIFPVPEPPRSPMMDWIGGSVVEVVLLVSVLVADHWLRLSERIAERVRRLASEKARVGVRTLLYSLVVGAYLFIFGFEDIVEDERLGTPAPVIVAILLVGSFVVATLRTAGETPSAQQTPPNESSPAPSRSPDAGRAS